MTGNHWITERRGRDTTAWWEIPDVPACYSCHCTLNVTESVIFLQMSLPFLSGCESWLRETGLTLKTGCFSRHPKKQPSTTDSHLNVSRFVSPPFHVWSFSRPVCQPRLKREGNGRKIEGRKKTSFNFSLFFLLLHLRCFLFWWQLYCQFNSMLPCLSHVFLMPFHSFSEALTLDLRSGKKKRWAQSRNRVEIPEEKSRVWEKLFLS